MSKIDGSTTYAGELQVIGNGKNYPIDIEKIQTINDVKYLLLAFINVPNGQCLYLNENCVYFDKLKHLIKE